MKSIKLQRKVIILVLALASESRMSLCSYAIPEGRMVEAASCTATGRGHVSPGRSHLRKLSGSRGDAMMADEEAGMDTSADLL